MINNGHPLLSAPYGLYKTTDGYIALAMMDIYELADAINCKELKGFAKDEVFAKRDEIKKLLAKCFANGSSSHWIGKMHESGLWAIEVFDWEQMMEHEAYLSLQMEQVLNISDKNIKTTRCPIRINGERLYADKAAPKLGEHNKQLMEEFGIRN
jgi:crotonobetainyl-CoA:carnitine CoA-transferase CaiB-like acyl-CoA transferase